MYVVIYISAQMCIYCLPLSGTSLQQRRAQRESAELAYTKAFLSEQVKEKENAHMLSLDGFRLYSLFCVLYSLFF